LYYHACAFVAGAVQLLVHIAVDQLLLLFHAGLSFRLLIVRLFVEVGEQEQEHDAVKTDPDHESLRVVAFSEQQLELVRENGHELKLERNGGKYINYLF
jgi:hypothetical protein